MGEQDRDSWKRKFNKLAPLAAVVAGLLTVLTSFFLEHPTGWYVTLGVGVIVILVGFWYADHPIFTSTRRHTALRAEVDQFILLVRELNAAAARGSQKNVQRVKAAMLESVERMEGVAGKEN